MSKASKRYHNRVAKKYDAIYDDTYWQFHDAVTWELVKPYLPTDANARCLDIGCGTGKWGLKLMKSGYAVTFGDNSPAMVGEVRGKLAEMGAAESDAAGSIPPGSQTGRPGSKADACEALEVDIAHMAGVEGALFDLVLGMGDPLSMCSSPQRAANELYRVAAPGGVVVATADNRLSAAAAYLSRGDIDGLSALLKNGRTRWITSDAAEQFELHTFTPTGLRKLFERSGFEVVSVLGKTVLPIREHRELLEDRKVFRQLVKLELDLCRDPHHAAKAGHLQITAKRPG